MAKSLIDKCSSLLEVIGGVAGGACETCRSGTVAIVDEDAGVGAACSDVGGITDGSIAIGVGAARLAELEFGLDISIWKSYVG